MKSARDVACDVARKLAEGVFECPLLYTFNDWRTGVSLADSGFDESKWRLFADTHEIFYDELLAGKPLVVAYNFFIYRRPHELGMVLTRPTSFPVGFLNHLHFLALCKRKLNLETAHMILHDMTMGVVEPEMLRELRVPDVLIKPVKGWPRRKYGKTLDDLAITR